MGVNLLFFIFCNVGIVLGYLFVGLFMLPRTTEYVRRLIPGVHLRMNATTWGGIFFFLTCAGTHADHAIHTALQPDAHIGDIAIEAHMLVIHGVQVVAVWTLILGVLFEFVRPVSRALQGRANAQNGIP